MRRNRLSSIRRIAAVAVLSAAPLLASAPSASALAVGQTVCYRDDGTAVFNPLSEDGFEYCVTRTGSSGGGGNGPVLCTISSTTYYCTPLQPLQG
jgi:hypothetical protein